MFNICQNKPTTAQALECFKQVDLQYFIWDNNVPTVGTGSHNQFNGSVGSDSRLVKYRFVKLRCQWIPYQNLHSQSLFDSLWSLLPLSDITGKDKHDVLKVPKCGPKPNNREMQYLREGTHKKGGNNSSLFKNVSFVHHVKVRTCGLFDNLRRTSARTHPTGGVTQYSVDIQFIFAER